MGAVFIGYRGENSVREIKIPVSHLTSEFPGMSVCMSMVPVGGSDDDAYLLDTTLEGDCLIWHVHGADVATSGTTKAAVRLVDGSGRIALDHPFEVFISANIGASGEMPDVYIPWIDRLAIAAANANEAADKANQAANKIPQKTSDLENDSGFVTNAANDLVNYYLKSETYTRDEINQRLSAIPKFSIEVVASLPTTAISETTLYLVGGGASGNLYTEYIYVGGTWEIIGSQRVDLTGYATETWVIGQLAGYQPRGDYALKSDIPIRLNGTTSTIKPIQVYAAAIDSGNEILITHHHATYGWLGFTAFHAVGEFVSASVLFVWEGVETVCRLTGSIYDNEWACVSSMLVQENDVPSNTSQLKNDSGFVTNVVGDLVNYYLKSETYTREEINQKIGLIPKLSIEVVPTLPTENISPTTIYFVGAEEGNDPINQYTEFLFVNGKWESIGTHMLDLSGYATHSWVDGKLLEYQPKGDYALKSEVPESVNEALAQAAASGEFDGKDGTSPTASVEQTEDGAVITISDVEGTTTAVVKNGQDGYTPQKGKDYVDGKDGTSLRHWWSGTVLYIESDPPSGEAHHGVDLEGPKGERGRTIYTTQRAPTISSDGSAYYNLSNAGLPYYDTKVGDLILCAENGDIYIVDELLTPEPNVVVTSVCNTKGVKGDDGVGIASVGVTRSPDENGFYYIIVNLTDGQQQAIPYKNGSDANVTTENITSALGYTPADAEDVRQLSEDIVGEDRINELIDAKLGVIENGSY